MEDEPQKIEELEKKDEQKVEERKNKIKKWFSNRTNLLLTLILLSALAIRLYYFSLTLDQPLWWDEAEYALKAKSFAFGTPLTGWAPEREIIVPFLFSIILKLGLGEIGLRSLQLLVSLSTVLLTFFVISKITDKKIGLVSCFGLSFFWLHIFFSQRILLYLWVPALYLILVFLFYEGYINNRKNFLFLFSFFSALFLMTYFSVGFLLFGIFLFLIFTEGVGLIKNKKALSSLGIFSLTLLPFMVYFQINYGFPIPRLAIGYTATTSEYGAGLQGIFSYVNMIPSRVGWAFLLLSFFGLIIFLSNLIIGLGIKNHLKKNSEWLLIFLSFFTPFLLYTLYGVVGGSATFYDAFILGVFPFLFAFAGLATIKIYSFGKKYHRLITIFFLITLFGLHMYFGIQQAHLSINSKLNSYDSVKYSGLWIKENTIPSEKVISASLPQTTYYSERITLSLPKTESEFLDLIRLELPKYFIDSVWEPVPDWVHNLSLKHNSTFIPVKTFSLGETNQLSLIIYELNHSI